MLFLCGPHEPRFDMLVFVSNTCPSVCQVRRLGSDGVIAGFAGATADALTLFERLEAKLEEHPGSVVLCTARPCRLVQVMLPRVCVCGTTPNPAKRVSMCLCASMRGIPHPTLCACMWFFVAWRRQCGWCGHRATRACMCGAGQRVENGEVLAKAGGATAALVSFRFVSFRCVAHKRLPHSCPRH